MIMVAEFAEDLHNKISHQNYCNDIDWEGVKVLDKETNWFRRGVKEAINIKRTNSDLNRDRGRHHLPRSYNRIILC